VDVIIAARLSQRRAGQSGIESQDEDAREWAREQGHNVVETVADHASGMKAMWQRRRLRPWVTDPELMEKYQGIVAAKQDRLSRQDFMDEVELRRWAEENGKTLFIVERELWWPPREGAHYDDDVANWNRGAEDAHREWNKDSRRWKRSVKQRASNNELSGKPIYGFQVQGINCGQIPCRCWERKIDDHKTLVIYKPQADVIREAKDRYLAGESLEKICADFNARGIPSPTGKKWWPRSLGLMLRNPSLAGRRMDSTGKTIMTYPGIITWSENEQIVARMDSRAYRKGISPANVYMLTGVIFDGAEHALYHITNTHGQRHEYYLCRQGCGVCPPMKDMDDQVSKAVIKAFGHLPNKMLRIIPGKNNFEDMARLRQDRSELDDLADDYTERHAELTAEIRRLAQEDKENPQPNEIKWVESGQTIAEYWKSLSVAGRRDWLIEHGWKVYPYKTDDQWSITVHIAPHIVSGAVPMNDITFAQTGPRSRRPPSTPCTGR
jgi:DNA invertase Pin-like site-specific DNA recombinase